MGDDKVKKSNCVNVPCMGDDWIIIQENYGTKNTGADSAYVPYVYNTEEYFVFNVDTGETQTLFKIQDNELVLLEGGIHVDGSLSGEEYLGRPETICMEGENLYFLMNKKESAGETEKTAVLRADLKDECITELGIYEGSDPFDAKGFVYKDILYFSEKTTGIYSVSIEGGEVSFTIPDSRFYLISDMEKVEDSLYLELINGTTNPDHLMCQWNPETMEKQNLTEALSDYYSVFWTGESFCTYYMCRGSMCTEYRP